MKIAGFKIYRYRLPLRRAFPVRDTSINVREGLLLKLRGGSDATGWGEASPMPGWSVQSLDDTTEEMVSVSERLLGCEVASEGILSGEIGDIAGMTPAARFGLEAACLNLYAAGSGVPLRRVLSKRARDAIRVNVVLNRSGAAPAVQVKEAFDRGIRSLKLKVGRAPIEEDIEWVRALAVAAHGRATLRLDANRAWTIEQAQRFAAGVEGCKIEYIEEPLSDPALLPGFVRETPLHVAIDETLVEQGVSAIAAIPGLSAVVVKPTLLGGIGLALRIAEAAHERGVACVISSSLESGVGLRCLAALASAVPGGDVAHGLDTLSWFLEDAVEPPMRAADGTIRLPEIEKFAMMLREETVQEVTHG